ncbi:MAG: hypothetical protein CVU24_18530, partial [Betaproteobacteria bacterium HGW-Betaproteobacteria-18]
PVGAVRMTLDNGRAFMWTGGAWSALAVDQNGNLTVPGTLTAAGGKVIAWNAVGEGGVLQLVGANGTSMYLESNNGKFRLVNSPWSAEIFSVDQSGNVVANGRLTTNEYVQINGTATEGTACSPNGLVGRDGTGLLLSCQSGSWQKQGGENWNSLQFFTVTNGTVNLGPKKVCWSLGMSDCSVNTGSRVYKSGADWYATASGAGWCAPASGTIYAACLP